MLSAITTLSLFHVNLLSGYATLINLLNVCDRKFRRYLDGPVTYPLQLMLNFMLLASLTAQSNEDRQKQLNNSASTRTYTMNRSRTIPHRPRLLGNSVRQSQLTAISAAIPAPFVLGGPARAVFPPGGLPPIPSGSCWDSLWSRLTAADCWILSYEYVRCGHLPQPAADRIPIPSQGQSVSLSLSLSVSPSLSRSFSLFILYLPLIFVFI